MSNLNGHGHSHGGRRPRETHFLDKLSSPDMLRTMSTADMEGLAEEIRHLIKDAVARHGGHLASNLGLVELTMALHRVFDFSYDRLLWDVGHQAYVHKILTGRGPKMIERLRCAGGISGFPSPDESPYDQFFVGHAGTAVPTATGLAIADDLNRHLTEASGDQPRRRVVALVGDASIVNGVAFEGLNLAGKLKRQLLIILNDNGMSIDVAQGALAETLAKFRSSRFYEEVKRKCKEILPRVPGGNTAYSVLDHLKEGIKATISPHQLFEQMGFMYVGPTDGHDLPHLIDLIDRLADVEHPVLLHVQTEKGRGFSFAREEPCKFHSPSPFTEDEEGSVQIKASSRKSWTSAFADAMKQVMAQDPRVVALTAAMPDGTGVSAIRKQFPDRSFDCGIAESATTDIAAGMCKAGLRPVAAIYSTFMQRAFDQAFQEVSLQRLPVVFAMDRAGLVGEDGAVHHGFVDIAFLRGLPGFHLCAPADEPELLLALQYALQRTDGPTALRYPRDSVPDAYAALADTPAFAPGKARKMRDGCDGAILAYGTMVQAAMDAAADLQMHDGLTVAVYNMRFAKPVDCSVLRDWLPRHVPVLTVEDHSIAGGFGACCLEAANDLRLPTERLSRLGMPADAYISFATRAEQIAQCGLDAKGIRRSFTAALEEIAAAASVSAIG